MVIFTRELKSRLICMKPWVQPPALEKKKELKNSSDENGVAK
jgi:hypothetical protein